MSVACAVQWACQCGLGCLYPQGAIAQVSLASATAGVALVHSRPVQWLSALKFKSLPRWLIALAESNMSSSASLVSGGNAGVLGATARAGLPWGLRAPCRAQAEALGSVWWTEHLIMRPRAWL